MSEKTKNSQVSPTQEAMLPKTDNWVNILSKWASPKEPLIHPPLYTNSLLLSPIATRQWETRVEKNPNLLAHDDWSATAKHTKQNYLGTPPQRKVQSELLIGPWCCGNPAVLSGRGIPCFVFKGFFVCLFCYFKKVPRDKSTTKHCRDLGLVYSTDKKLNSKLWAWIKIWSTKINK